MIWTEVRSYPSSRRPFAGPTTEGNPVFRDGEALPRSPSLGPPPTSVHLESTFKSIVNCPLGLHE